MKTERDERREFATNHYEALFRKAGIAEFSTSWTFADLRNKLEPWEFNFLIASMHYHVSDNAGHVGGLRSFLDNEEKETAPLTAKELIEAWHAVGYAKIHAETIAGEEALKKTTLTKYDDLAEADYQMVETAMEKAGAAHKIEEDINVVFKAYILKNSGGE